MLKTSLTVAQIAEILDSGTMTPEMMTYLENDSRHSVVRLLTKWKQAKAKQEQDLNRVQNLYSFERKFHENGYTMIAGIDEAGRGPLAGPVVIGCVILPLECHLPHLNDSKKLTPKQRDNLYNLIKEKALAVGCTVIPVNVIDKMNIYQATRFGMYQVIEELSPQPDAVLIDAVPLPELMMPSKSILGGDACSASIAAASIIAKVERDRIMDQLDIEYPHYGFGQHKGYATPEHLEKLRKYGPCAIHRKSFEPVKSWRLNHEDQQPGIR